MWKESYRIGVDVIDNQHIGLFQSVGELLQAINTNAGREEYARTIQFLRNYVKEHFNDEEQYHELIQYAGRETHKRIHRQFSATVEEYERKLEETDYDPAVVMRLSGVLLSWLIDHVTNEDQKILKGDHAQPEEISQTYANIIESCVLDTVFNLADMNPSQVKCDVTQEDGLIGDCTVAVDLYGDIDGSFTFEVTEPFALNLIEHMSMRKANQIDDMICSALAEMTEISMRKAIIRLADKGLKCESMPAVASTSKSWHIPGGIVARTPIGDFKLSAEIDRD